LGLLCSNNRMLLKYTCYQKDGHDIIMERPN